MSKAKLIWVGPGVLNPAERGKDKKPLMPGDSIPDGFVTRERVEGLKKKGRIASESAYAKSQAAAGIKPGEDAGKLKELTKVETPGKRKVHVVTEFLGISPKELVKTMVFMADEKPVAVILRGDHEVQTVKLANALGINDDNLRLADDKEVFDATGVPSGYLGPIGIKIPVLADLEITRMHNFAIGANEKNYHFTFYSPIVTKQEWSSRFNYLMKLGEILNLYIPNMDSTSVPVRGIGMRSYLSSFQLFECVPESIADIVDVF